MVVDLQIVIELHMVLVGGVDSVRQGDISPGISNDGPSVSQTKDVILSTVEPAGTLKPRTPGVFNLGDAAALPSIPGENPEYTGDLLVERYAKPLIVFPFVSCSGAHDCVKQP